MDLNSSPRDASRRSMLRGRPRCATDAVISEALTWEQAPRHLPASITKTPRSPSPALPLGFAQPLQQMNRAFTPHHQTLASQSKPLCSTASAGQTSGLSQIVESHAPLNVNVALSPTFVLVWNVALDPGSMSVSKLHWQRYAVALSGRGVVTADAEAVGDEAAELVREELCVGLGRKKRGKYAYRTTETPSRNMKHLR